MLKEFKSFVEKHNLIGRDDRVLLALSGGVDSMVLAKLLLISQQDNKTTRQQGNLVVDVANLNSGVYFVKIVTSEGEIVKRFVKN